MSRGACMSETAALLPIETGALVSMEEPAQITSSEIGAEHIWPLVGNAWQCAAGTVSVATGVGSSSVPSTAVSLNLTSCGFANLTGHVLQYINAATLDEVSHSGGSNVRAQWSYFSINDPIIRLTEIRQACVRNLTHFESAIPRRVFESIRNSVAVLLDPEGWDGDDKLPSLKSFLYVLSFVSRHADCRAPALTISNDGNFVATWIKTRANVVRCEFRPDGSLNWLFILAPVDSMSRGEQGTGDGPISKSEKVLTDFGVWEIMKAGK